MPGATAGGSRRLSTRDDRPESLHAPSASHIRAAQCRVDGHEARIGGAFPAVLRWIELPM